MDDDKADLRDREDEAPQVVPGIGVSQEEANDFVQQNLISRRPQKNERNSDSDEEEPTTEEIEAEKSGECN